MSQNAYLFACLSFLCACASSPENNLSMMSTDNPALHAVQNGELRELMDRMNCLMMERFMTEHEMDIERRRHANQIIETARNLSATAKMLIVKLPALDLNAGEQQAFHHLADKLGQNADKLQKQAENHLFTAMSDTLHDIQATCLACHTLFRKS